MVIQKTQIVRKDLDELNVAIADLELRGYKVTKIEDPETIERKHFDYTEKREGFRKRYGDTEVVKRYRASLERDFQV